MKQVLIGGNLIDWGVMVMSLIAKNKQTVLKLGISLTLLALTFLVHTGIRGGGIIYPQILKPLLNLKFLSKSNKRKT